jgi:flagellar basal-body rod protein FlgF
MPDALAIVAKSMADDMLRLASISYNLANAASPGFKQEMMVSRAFSDHITASGMRLPTALGVTLSEPGIMLDHRAGSLQFTGNALDVALEGDGFFELAAQQGPVYTRQGNFQLDATGRLMSTMGFPVMGTAGEMHIASSQPRIDRDGRIYDDDDKLAGQLRVMRFSDPSKLLRAGAGMYAPAGQSAAQLQDARIRQGYLENSNVVPVHEMVRLIETMRHFESSQKVIQSYDEMLERAIRTLGEF